MAPTFPRAIERRLSAVALRWVRSWLRPVMREARKALRRRADVDEIQPGRFELLSILTSIETVASADEQVTAASLGRYGRLVTRHAERETLRILQRPSLRAIDPAQNAEGVIAAWSEEAASRIVVIQERYRERVSSIVERAYAEGWGAERLAGSIERLGAATENRARLWARDQIATINEQATAHAHALAGVRFYVWATANDERVREEHVERDGFIFAWDNPPRVDDIDGHPGESINCRCAAIPVDPAEEQELIEAQTRRGGLPAYAVTAVDL